LRLELGQLAKQRPYSFQERLFRGSKLDEKDAYAFVETEGSIQAVDEPLFLPKPPGEDRLAHTREQALHDRELEHVLTFWARSLKAHAYLELALGVVADKELRALGCGHVAKDIRALCPGSGQWKAIA